MLVGDGEDPPAGMGSADLEVVQAATPAQGDRAVPVGDVVAEAEVARGARAGRQRLGRRPVRLAGRDPPGRPVRPLLVVFQAEGVESGLQLGDAGRRRPAPEPSA